MTTTETLPPIELDLAPLSDPPRMDVTALDEGWDPPRSTEKPTGRFSIPPTFGDPFGIYEDILGDQGDDMAMRAISAIKNRLFIMFARESLKLLRSGETKRSIESVIILSHVIFHLGVPYADIEEGFTEAEFLRLRARINAHVMQKFLSVPPDRINLSHLALIYEAIAYEPGRFQIDPLWISQADRSAHVAFAQKLVRSLRSEKGSRGIFLLLQEAIRAHRIDPERELALSQEDYAEYQLAYDRVDS